MIRNKTTGGMLASEVVCFDTFWRKGRGLMFRSKRFVSGEKAFLFVENRESIAKMAVHMFFVFFPIAVIWLDSDKRVVDMVLARPFRPYYAPREPARYYLEGHPALLQQVNVGDQLGIESR